jgi:hypothetical protein
MSFVCQHCGSPEVSQYASGRETRNCQKCKALLQYNRNKAWRLANPDAFRAHQKKYRQANPGGKWTESLWRAKLARVYKMTQEQYTEMLERQRGGCAICGKTEDKRLAVDHCHITGRVRGLLCSRHNRGLGYFSDSPSLLNKAAEYLHGAA